MKKIICFMIVLMLLLTIITAAYADDLSVEINIYQNEQYIGHTYIDAMCGEDLNITSLNALYGDLSTATVTINGTPGIVFTWALPDFVTYMGANYSNVEPGDSVVVNLYYTIESEEPEPEEIIYGNILLDIGVPYPVEPYESYYISLQGVKGVDIISDTYYFDNEGLFNIDVDTSYSWTFTFNGITYNVDQFPYYTQLSIPQNVPDPIIDEEEVAGEHNVFIRWEYAKEAGGTMVDGEGDNTFVFNVASFTATAGDILNLKEYAKNPPGGEFIEEGSNGFLIKISNNVYRLGTIYKSGGTQNSKWPLDPNAPLDATPMVNDDLEVTFHYTWVYTEPETVEVEVPVEKIVEVPVEKIVTVEKQVPVQKIITVEKEVPVTKVITSDPIIITIPTVTPTPTDTIEDDDTPLAPPSHITRESVWSLLSLMLLILTIMALFNLPRHEKEYNLFNLLILILSVIVFFIFEDSKGEMVWIDKSTIWIFILYLSELVSRVYAKDRENNDSKEKETT